MNFGDSDDDDFSVSVAPDAGASNRLSSLFSAEPAKASAPQQQPAQQKSKESQVLHYAAVQLYKYSESGTFDNVGKIGAAIIANPAQNTYQLLCYRTPKDYLCVSTIRGNQFSYTVQNGQYGSFYDDKRQLWSLLFKGTEEAFFFAVHIAFAKHCTQAENGITVVDLNEGTGNPVENGSKVNVKYTGWLLNDLQTGLPKLGKTFDSNVSSEKLFRFKVGEGSVIQGWDKGVLGMKKQGNAKRFIIVPPQLGYGAKGVQGSIPPNATLCFQVELVPSSSARKNSASHPPQLEQQQQAVMEQQASPQQPLDLKARMAKIGQAILVKQEEEYVQQQPASVVAVVAPTVQQVVPQSPPQQTPTTPVQQQQQPAAAVVAVTPIAQQPAAVAAVTPVATTPQDVASVNALQQQIAVLQQMLVQQQQAVVTAVVATPQQQAQQQQPAAVVSQPQVQPQVQPAQQVQPQPAAAVTNTTQDNSKILSRLDEIANKIDHLDLATLVQPKKKDGDNQQQQSFVMSAPLLLQTIQHLVSTCEQQAKDLGAEREKVDQLIEKMSQLRKRNEKYAQEVSNHLSASSVDVEYLHQEIEHQQKQNQELKKRVGQVQQLVDRERDQNQELENQVTQLSADKQAAQKQVERLQQKLAREDVEHKQTVADLKEAHERRIEELMKQQKDKSNDHSSELMELKSKCALYSSQLAEREREKRELSEQLNSRLEQALAEREAQLKAHYELKRIELQELELEKVKAEHVAALEALQSASEQERERLLAAQEARLHAEHETRLAEELAQLKAQFREQVQAKLQQVEQENEEQRQADQDMFKQMFKDRVKQIQEQGNAEALDALKQTMSKVYFAMNKRVTPEHRYRGHVVLQGLLGSIKKMTMALVQHVEAGNPLADFEQGEDEEEELLQHEEEVVVATRTIQPPVVVAVKQEEEEEATLVKVPVKQEEELPIAQKEIVPVKQEEEPRPVEVVPAPPPVEEEASVEPVASEPVASEAIEVAAAAATIEVKQEEVKKEQEEASPPPQVVVEEEAEKQDNVPVEEPVAAEEPKPTIEQDASNGYDEITSVVNATSAAEEIVKQVVEQVVEDSISFNDTKQEPPIHIPEEQPAPPQLSPEEQAALKEKEMAAKKAKLKTLFMDDL